MKMDILLLSLILLAKSASALICLKCDDIYQPRHCHYVTRCNNDEVCGTERFQTGFGGYSYKLGCVKSSTCSMNANNGTQCRECCSSKDLCNAASCGEPGYPADKGMVCYNCEDYNKPEQCHKIAHCSQGQICRIDRRIEFGDVIMTSGCRSSMDCWDGGSSGLIGKRDSGSTVDNTTCRDCCLSDFCNRDCDLGPCMSSPCQHGDCSVRGTTYACVCEPGWTGLNCERLLDACASYPCVHGKCRYPMPGSTTVHECQCESGWTGQRCDQKRKIGFDCLNILTSGLGSTDGVYDIKLNNSDEIIKVYCDMTTDKGGWTVFQRRFNGSVDFFRNFSEYENGFGSPFGEHWLGLRYIYNLTHGAKSNMRFDMWNASGDTIFELDKGFRLRYPPYYELMVDGWTSSIYERYKSNTGVGYYNGHPFSTIDRDLSHYACANHSHGAFWYSACSDVNPNGAYVTPGTLWSYPGPYNAGHYGGMIYYQWMGWKSLKETKMMIRRT